MNKKGFTLIELIAVLIILTVITAILMPNLVKYVNKNREESAKSIEKLLITNLELYNADKEQDLWKDDKTCITVSIEDLVNQNKDIDMGECLLTNEKALTITKENNTYKYYVNITCGKALESMSSNKYILAFANKVYYKSDNIYKCD
jgi:prepilin-type N-terminal cleavage/methylation domain-containing protein